MRAVTAEPIRDPLPVPGLDGAQSGHPGQVDHAGGLEQAVLHLRQEVGASRQQLGLGPALGQGFDTVFYAVRKDELESSHARSPRRLVCREAPSRFYCASDPTMLAKA